MSFWIAPFSLCDIYGLMALQITFCRYEKVKRDMDKRRKIPTTLHICAVKPIFTPEQTNDENTIEPNS